MKIQNYGGHIRPISYNIPLTNFNIPLLYSCRLFIDNNTVLFLDEPLSSLPLCCSKLSDCPSNAFTLCRRVSISTACFWMSFVCFLKTSLCFSMRFLLFCIVRSVSSNFSSIWALYLESTVSPYAKAKIARSMKTQILCCLSMLYQICNEMYPQNLKTAENSARSS